MKSSLVAALALCLCAAPAFAQNMPTPQEIDKRVEEEMQKLPVKKVEHEVVTIEYREMPSDPKEVVKRAAGNQVPPGMSIDQLIKQYMPMARPYVEKHAQKLGTLKVTKDVKVASAKLKPDQTYDFGLLMDNLTPIGIVIGGGDLKAPLKLPLKPKKTETTYEVMTVTVEPATKTSKNKVVIDLGFAASLGSAGPLGF